MKQIKNKLKIKLRQYSERNNYLTDVAILRERERGRVYTYTINEHDIFQKKM